MPGINRGLAELLSQLFIKYAYISKKPSRSPIKRICKVNTPKLNTCVTWDTDNEELAIKIYTDVSSNKNSQFKSKCINDVVMHTDLDMRSFGPQASP